MVIPNRAGSSANKHLPHMLLLKKTIMSTPENNVPAQEPNGGPKTNKTGQDIVTNADEADKVVNKDGADGAVADMDGIQETLSDSEPSTALNADTQATDSQIASGDTVTDAEIAGDKQVI